MSGEDRDDAGYVEGVRRLANTLLNLLDRRKPLKSVRNQEAEPGAPQATGKVVEIGRKSVSRSRLHRVEHAATRNIRPLAEMTIDEIILAARAKGRQLSRTEAAVVKDTAGDTVAEDVETVMYKHGFFSS